MAVSGLSGVKIFGSGPPGTSPGLSGSASARTEPDQARLLAPGQRKHSLFVLIRTS